jgi:transposase-like protein
MTIHTQVKCPRCMQPQIVAVERLTLVGTPPDSQPMDCPRCGAEWLLSVTYEVRS